MKYRVLLYYKFVPLRDLAELRDRHQAQCAKLGLKGRVYLAQEGINGTVAGSLEATEAYKHYLEHDEGFGPIQWKEDDSDYIPFAKLKTKVRNSLVNLGEGDDPELTRFSGKRLSPQEWKKLLESDPNIVLLDVRNRYESEVGRFRGAICPDIENFYEFPKWVEELLAKKEVGAPDKKVLMYCTGGIRCEKFSALLVKKGITEVYQLDGGILTYGKEVGGTHFEGTCFVFDDRLTVSVGESKSVISACRHCGEPESRYLNCSNMECNDLFICCDACAAERLGACCEGCRNAPGRRPFDPANFRVPYRKKGVVFPELGRSKA